MRPSGESIDDRTAQLLANWPAVATALELAYGRVHRDDRSPGNARAWGAWVSTTRRFCLHGAPAVAAWCHERRLKATTGVRVAGTRYGRGVSAERLFVASTLDRAYRRTATDLELADGLAAGFERITGNFKPLPSATSRAITDFVWHVSQKAGQRVDVASLPNPAAKATHDHGCRDGGQYAGVDDWGRADGLRAFRVQHAAVLAILRAGRNRFEQAAETLSAMAPEELMPLHPSDLEASRRALAHAEAASRWPADVSIDALLAAMPAAVRSTAHWNVLVAQMRRSGTYDALRLQGLANRAYDRAGQYHVALLRASRGTPGAPIDELVRRLLPRAPARWPQATDTQLLAASPLAIAVEACRRVAARTEPAPCEMRAFANAAGKLRLATVHPTDVVMAARAITRWLLGRLRRVRTNKAMLRAETVRLQPAGPDAVAYSADLSKATDRISTATARLVLRTALAATDAPAWMSEALDGVTGDMLVTAGDRTAPLRCGALMGLGPSWIALSLLNDYAACSAGAPTSSFAVCGDDLLAYWPRELCDRYEKRLSAVGLVANSDKSFRGSRGVFCEQFAQVERGVLVARSVYRLGETSGAKSIEGRRGEFVCDDLRRIAETRGQPGWIRTPGPVRRLASRTLAAVALRGAPGELAHGGGGIGKADACTAAAFILSGAAALATRETTHRMAEVGRQRTRALAGLPTDPRGRRLREVAADHAAADAAKLFVRGEWRAMGRSKPVHRAENRAAVLSARRRAARIGPFDALRTPSAIARWGARARAVAHAHFARGRFASGCTYLATHTRRVAEAGTVQPLFPVYLQTCRRPSPQLGGQGPTQHS